MYLLKALTRLLSTADRRISDGRLYMIYDFDLMTVIHILFRGHKVEYVDGNNYFLRCLRLLLWYNIIRQAL